MTSKRYEFRPIEKLGATAALWLLISGISNLVTILWSIGDIVLLTTNQASTPLWQAWQLFGLAAFVEIALYVTAVVIVARWVYRASANTHASVRKLDTSPPWAVGWFFIPFANLWKPYQAISEIARANLTTSHTLPLGAWWGLWIVSNIAGNISYRLAGATSAEGLIGSSAFGLISGLTSIGAALLMRKIVLAISDAQTAHKQADVF